jgi:hypothetical protein
MQDGDEQMQSLFAVPTIDPTFKFDHCICIAPSLRGTRGPSWKPTPHCYCCNNYWCSTTDTTAATDVIDTIKNEGVMMPSSFFRYLRRFPGLWRYQERAQHPHLSPSRWRHCDSPWSKIWFVREALFIFYRMTELWMTHARARRQMICFLWFVKCICLRIFMN